MRRTGELLLPGCAIGLIAGGLAGGVSALAGLPPSYVVATAMALGVPLALFGAGYNALLAAGRMRIGGVAPAVAYWLVGFPLSRAAHEIMLDVMLGRGVGLSDAVLPFLAYQALLSVGFGIGFVWLHEQVAPIWWVRVRHHNPVAQHYVDVYAQQALKTEQRKAARSKQRARSRPADSNPAAGVKQAAGAKQAARPKRSGRQQPAGSTTGRRSRNTHKKA